ASASHGNAVATVGGDDAVREGQRSVQTGSNRLLTVVQVAESTNVARLSQPHANQISHMINHADCSINKRPLHVRTLPAHCTCQQRTHAQGQNNFCGCVGVTLYSVSQVISTLRMRYMLLK